MAYASTAEPQLSYLNASPEMTLSEALTCWITITGVDPGETRYSLGNWNVMDMHRELKEALELDSTEVTGKLIFDYLATKYLAERTFTAEMLLEKPEQVAAYLAQCQRLLAFLRDESMQEIKTTFQEKLRAACRQYAGETAPDLLDKPHLLAILRRDALRTMQSLRVDQFLEGAPEPAGYRPVYGKFVYRWQNVNSMLQHMTRMPSGVTLNMICHPTDPYRTYFAFAIRNGGKLFVFTDKEKTPHPMAEDLYRRPERVLANRAARNWFPYELMGLAYAEDGKPFLTPTDSEALVPYQQDLQPVRALAALEPATFVWLVMMLDLIVEKFWHAGYTAPALSYTAEMIQHQRVLADAAQTAGLPVTTQHPVLRVTPLTVADLHSNVVDEAQVGRFGHGAHAWLEERYGHRVLPETLNLLGREDQPLALAYAAEGAQIVPHGEAKFGEPARRTTSLDTVTPSLFGTQAEIEANRRFIARSNYARQINALAQEEFHARKKEVLAWVRTRITNNLDALYLMMKAPEHNLPARKLGAFDRGAYTGRQETDSGVTRLFMRKASIAGDDAHRLDSHLDCAALGNLAFLGSKGWTQRIPPCFHTNAAASWSVEFFPEETEDLALLCGCTVAELPDVLQHWTLYRKYVGNSILDRIDPLEWQCHNPWAALHFKLTFFFSKRAMRAIEKA